MSPKLRVTYSVINTYICIYTQIYFVYILSCTYTRVCVYVCVRAFFMCVCVCVYVCVCVVGGTDKGTEVMSGQLSR